MQSIQPPWLFISSLTVTPVNVFKQTIYWKVWDTGNKSFPKGFVLKPSQPPFRKGEWWSAKHKASPPAASVLTSLSRDRAVNTSAVQLNTCTVGRSRKPLSGVQLHWGWLWWWQGLQLPWQRDRGERKVSALSGDKSLGLLTDKLLFKFAWRSSKPRVISAVMPWQDFLYCLCPIWHTNSCSAKNAFYTLGSDVV